MKTIGIKLPYLLTFLSLVALALIQFGCDSYPSKYVPEDTYSYRFEGALVKDLNTDFTSVVATLTREDSILPEAEIRFDGDSLAFTDSAFWRAVLPAGDYPAGSYDIEIRDSSFFHDTLTTILAGDFAIDTVWPEWRYILPFQEVKLEWHGSANTQGYVMAAVKMESAYTGAGFSQYVLAEQGPSGTFDPNAFALPGGTDNEPDPGWYYLYVYSYVGSPDSALSAALLPAPMPSQLGDNISVKDLDGRFGTIVVTQFDSMLVLVE